MAHDGPEHTSGEENASPSRLDRVLRTTYLAALAVLLFLAGSIVTLGDFFPAPYIARAYRGGEALYYKLIQYDDVFGTDLWYPERRPGKGVTIHRPESAQDGITLYTSGSDSAAYLIDMNGEVLHSWRRPFSSASKGKQGPLGYQSDRHIYFRHAHVFPNGDLLAIYEAANDTPYGYGVVKLNRDSDVIWMYPGRAHHQFDVGPDGRIYVLTHEFVDDRIPDFEHLHQPRLEDFLVILSPDGEEQQKIRLAPALAKSPFRHALYILPDAMLDEPTHANSVKYIDRDAAAAFAFGKEGQILLSFRETSSILVLDPETQEIVWATGGPWIGQHDPDILPNGNILMFDNYGNYMRPNGASRVIEFDPVTMEIVWRYTGTPEDPLESLLRADQQRLANGNTLITESSGGRLLEVTSDGEVVWEYINPVRGGNNNGLIPIIGWARRLDRTDVDPMLVDAARRRN